MRHHHWSLTRKQSRIVIITKLCLRFDQKLISSEASSEHLGKCLFITMFSYLEVRFFKKTRLFLPTFEGSGGRGVLDIWRNIPSRVWCRGFYTVARRYELYFRVAKQYFTNDLSEWVEYCFCHEKIKFISSSLRVMFFLLYRQNDIDKIIEGNYQNYVIDKLTCEIMENKPLGSRM